MRLELPMRLVNISMQLCGDKSAGPYHALHIPLPICSDNVPASRGAQQWLDWSRGRGWRCSTPHPRPPGTWQALPCWVNLEPRQPAKRSMVKWTCWDNWPWTRENESHERTSHKLLKLKKSVLVRSPYPALRQFQAGSLTGAVAS